MSGIEGLNELISILKNAIPTPEEVNAALLPIAERLVIDMKARVPVKTGGLRDSISVIKRRKAQYIDVGPLYSNKQFKIEGGGGNHANLVEYGFTHFSGKTVAPRPFIRPTFEQNKTSILAELEKTFLQLIEKKGAELK